MVFLIAQQAPEPQWNTISSINSHAAYEILKKFCSSLSKNHSAQFCGGGEGLLLFWWNFPSFGKGYI